MALGITEQQFHALAETITRALEPLLRDQNRQDIAAEMFAYRQAVSVRDRWCCHDMQTFAGEVWHASQPSLDREALGSVTYTIRGHHVNFCPFCGVHFSVGLAESAAKRTADTVRRTA